MLGTPKVASAPYAVRRSAVALGVSLQTTITALTSSALFCAAAATPPSGNFETTRP